jgi:hypothetical protein
MKNIRTNVRTVGKWLARKLMPNHVIVRSSLDEATITRLRLAGECLIPHLTVFSHTTERERLALYQLSSSLPFGANALEIGSHLGSSALFLCAGLKKRSGRLYCVDTWMNETMADGIKDTFPSFSKNTEEYAPLITTIRKNSRELRPFDIPGGLDLVFIDGDHAEDQVRADFKTTAALLKLEGFIAFHDVSSNYPGVSVVIGEALASGAWQLAGLVDNLAWIRRMT